MQIPVMVRVGKGWDTLQNYLDSQLIVVSDS
jgi:hypothetical protein